MNTRLLAVLFCILGPASAVAGAVEIRFYPERQIWAQQTEAMRGLNNLILPNAAVVNRSEAAVSVAALRFELVSDDDVVQSQVLGSMQLQRVAAVGARLAGSGMMDLLGFQFGTDVLLGAGVEVAGQTRLEPGQALYLPTRFFAFAGMPQRLRVTVQLEDSDSEPAAELGIRYGAVPGSYRFPVRGRWYVAAAATPHSHHRWAVNQEFTLDLGRIGRQGRSHRGEGRRMRDYYAYGEPVYAVADGKVLALRASMPDSVDMLRRPGESIESQMARVQARQQEWLSEGGEAMVGNYVLLEHAEGVHTVYAHLAPGSIAVEVGQQVRSGQRLGAVGSSGSSTEPHLHFHACDRPSLMRCAGLPIAFEDIEIVFSDHPRQIQSGDVVDAR